MRAMRGDWPARCGRQARLVAAALIAGITRRDLDRVEAQLTARPRRDQTVIVAAVLGALFLCAVLAAQAGPIGLALYFVAVIVAVR